MKFLKLKRFICKMIGHDPIWNPYLNRWDCYRCDAHYLNPVNCSEFKQSGSSNKKFNKFRGIPSEFLKGAPRESLRLHQPGSTPKQQG